MAVDIDPFLGVIRDALPYAEWLARRTETIWDDRTVAFLRSAIDYKPLIAFLRMIADDPEVVSTSGPARTLAMAAACERCKTPEVVAAAEAAGFSWLEVIKYAQIVVPMILTLLGRRR